MDEGGSVMWYTACAIALVSYVASFVGCWITQNMATDEVEVEEVRLWSWHQPKASYGVHE